MGMTSTKALVILGIAIYLCLAVPATYGLVRLFTSDVTGGKCIKEFTIEKYHRTQGVVKIPSSVIKVQDSQFIVQNMTCDQFKAKPSVNVFKHAHPYFSAFSILVLIVTITLIIAAPIAWIIDMLSKLYDTWIARRSS